MSQTSTEAPPGETCIETSTEAPPGPGPPSRHTTSSQYTKTAHQRLRKQRLPPIERSALLGSARTVAWDRIGRFPRARNAGSKNRADRDNIEGQSATLSSGEHRIRTMAILADIRSGVEKDTLMAGHRCQQKYGQATLRKTRENRVPGHRIAT